MLGNLRIKKHSFYIFAVCDEDDILHCASYINEYGKEYIISIETGEKFYSLYTFAIKVLGKTSIDEYKKCFYYSENREKWRSIKYILKKRH
jgi:hypothetical protein